MPPGHVLFGSDVPYSTPTWGAHATARGARYLGLNRAQIASVMGGQARRLVARAEPADLGPALLPRPAGSPAPRRLRLRNELLDRYEKHVPHLDTGNEYAGWDLIATAALIVRTPGPPLPTT
ncbi:hypothetical protein [Lentzea flaviverrucosa]|uniref:Amidohydrolase n=1 Tax=Lentzea flaviverrucosa TaxID=200379 RepID=A0A1H9GZ01_9PSEU|nr:hypothetical protein [Lentzea flaviverrucosa]RDI34758.1 hypothetical protein DFR72_101507 [Lentzea flaviverrucosa]SEQ55223.1 hypothetical protein SAMN05216195_102710 [Lentzea flaviverrucosa]